LGAVAKGENLKGERGIEPGKRRTAQQEPRGRGNLLNQGNHSEYGARTHRGLKHPARVKLGGVRNVVLSWREMEPAGGKGGRIAPRIDGSRKRTSADAISGRYVETPEAEEAVIEVFRGSASPANGLGVRNNQKNLP